MTEETQAKACSMQKGFNYCFVAKSIVAIPALPIIAYASATLFTNPLLQVAGGSLAVILAVYIAMKIDAAPAFSGKVVKKD